MRLALRVQGRESRAKRQKKAETRKQLAEGRKQGAAEKIVLSVL